MIDSFATGEIILILLWALSLLRARHRSRQQLARVTMHTLAQPAESTPPSRLLSLTGRLFTHADCKFELLREGLQQLAELTAPYACTAAVAVRTGAHFDTPLVTGAFADRIRNRLGPLFAKVLEERCSARFWGSALTSNESFMALGIERWLIIPCCEGDDTIAAIWLGLRPGTLDMPLETLHEVELLGECFASALRAALRVAARHEVGQHRNAALITFSHDILAPSTNALLMVRELQSNSFDEGTSALLRGIEESLLRQFELITAALNLDQHPAPGSPVALPLAPLVERLLSEYTLAATAKGVQLQNMVYPGHAVWADAQQLLRILDNLISNAVRHSGGQFVTVSSRQHSDMLQIAVADDGLGIPEALQSELFIRHMKSSHSTGYGIGLAGARELALQNHGELQFKQNPRRGSCFIVTLPAAQISAPRRFRSALIVDDAPAVRRTLARYLSGIAQEIRTAATLKEAEQELSAHAPDLLITDWCIGDAVAESLLEQFGRERDDDRLALLLTGASELPCFERFRSNNNTRIVSKPLNRESLLAALHAPTDPQPKLAYGYIPT